MVKLYSPKIFTVFLLSVLFTAVTFTGCKKNTDISATDTGNPPDLTTKVRSSVSGFVTDENDQAVNLATVQVGTATVSTDKYGYFEAKNVDVVKDAAVVTVIKSGYFKGIKTYMAEEGKASFFRIKLIPKTNAGTVNAVAGGAVTLANGLSITLPANSVVNATTNSAYTGTVNVAAYWLNPIAADLPGIMPGDLRGINADGNIQLLTTYGMAAIELTGSGGELLQIATGKKATLSLPIPSSLVSSAPATIPLWYFDEAKGLWKEEGSATKTGSNYVGEVSHFSFWNCDVAVNYVQFNCTVVNSNNQPLSNILVKISYQSNPAVFRFGYTNSAGYVSGAIPKNAQLLLEIITDFTCTTVFYSQPFTTTNVNVSLGTITIPNTTSIALISGTVTNCSNNPVTNGYIIVQSGTNYSRFSLSNTGSYSVNLLLCNNTSNSVILIGEDAVSQQESNTSTYSITPGNNSIPVIQACGTSTLRFVHLTVNGNPQNYNILPDTIYMYQPGNNNMGIYYLPVPYVSYGYLSFTQTGIGVGSTQTLVTMAIPQVIFSLIINNPPVNVSITEYGAIGQFVAGNFAGSFTGPPPSNTQYNITCSFRVRRTF